MEPLVLGAGKVSGHFAVDEGLDSFQWVGCGQGASNKHVLYHNVTSLLLILFHLLSCTHSQAIPSIIYKFQRLDRK